MPTRSVQTPAICICTNRLCTNLADVRTRIFVGMKKSCPIAHMQTKLRARTVSAPGSQAPKKKKSLTDVIGAKLRKKGSYSSTSTSASASTSASMTTSTSSSSDADALPVVSLPPVSVARSRSSSRPHRARREERAYEREHNASLPSPSSGSSPHRQQTVQISSCGTFAQCHASSSSTDSSETVRLGRKIIPVFWPDSEQDDPPAPPPGLRAFSSSSSDTIDSELAGFRPLAPPPYHRRLPAPAASPHNVVSARQ